MRNGKHWPIPEQRLLDGASLALKNATRLCEDARVAYDSNRFSISLTLSVLALEEYGKCLMLQEAKGKGRKIDENIWHKEFENHGVKLDAILRILSSFGPPAGLEKEATRELKVLTNLFKIWRNKKLDGIYLDWDAEKAKWYNYNDKSDSEKKKEAREVLELTEKWLKLFSDALGDLAFATIDDIIEALQNGKAHCFCEDCASLMINEREFLKHARTYPDHDARWYKNPD